MTDEIERILLRKEKIHMFNIGPRTSAKGWMTTGWDKLHIWSGPAHIVATGDNIKIVFMQEDGKEFACAPIKDPINWELSVEPVLDSTRYFVVTLVDPSSGRRKAVGIGFDHRNDSFEFKASLIDHAAWVKSGVELDSPSTSKAPKLDFGLKPGEKLSISWDSTDNAHSSPLKPNVNALMSVDSELPHSPAGPGHKFSLFSSPAAQINSPAPVGSLFSGPPKQSAQFQSTNSPTTATTATTPLSFGSETDFSALGTNSSSKPSSNAGPLFSLFSTPAQTTQPPANSFTTTTNTQQTSSSDPFDQLGSAFTSSQQPQQQTQPPFNSDSNSSNSGSNWVTF